MNVNYPRPPSSPPLSNTATGSGTGSSELPTKDAPGTPKRSNFSPDKQKSKAQSAIAARTKTRSGDYGELHEILSPRKAMLDQAERTANMQDTNFPPTSNPRHRRSLSTGNEKWIDHRPPGTLDLGTVFRPIMKNKTSMSNLKNVNVATLNKADRYALTHHTANQLGEVETHVYKGEVIPSVAGGAQVVFSDVETLRQSSPPARKRAGSESRAANTPSTTICHDIEINSTIVPKRSRH